MQSVLIIGSNGFIGKSLIKLLSLSKFNLIGIDIVDNQEFSYKYEKISILSSEFLSFLSKKQFNIIINCSGNGNVNYSITNPVIDYELNTLGVFYILDAIRKCQNNCRYIHLSSAAVYGNPISNPISENTLIHPISPYGFHKWQSEIICQEFNNLFNIPILILRPFSVYGPGLKKQLLWDILTKSKQSKVIELWGTGKETRDFIYICDLCEILVKLIDINLPNYEVLNVASGCFNTVEFISKLLIDKMGLNHEIIFNTFKKDGDPTIWKADITKMLNYGLSVETSIEEGISKTAKWLIQHAS